MRGNVDYLTKTETKKKSTIISFVYWMQRNFFSQIKDKMLEGRNLLNPQMPGVSL